MKGLFLGYGNYGKKLFEYFNSACSIDWLGILVKNSRNDGIFLTEVDDKINDADVVVIALPDNHHAEWLLKLSNLNYKGAIFCEKSPIISLQQIDLLEKFSKLNVYYNFPLFFKKIDESLTTNKELNVVWGHNFAYKKNYPISWRSDANICPNGIGTSLGLHFIFWAIHNYGRPTSHILEYKNIAESGTSPDTMTGKLQFKENKILNFYISYAMPVIEKAWFTDENNNFSFPISSDLKENDFETLNNLFYSDNEFNELNILSVKFFLKEYVQKKSNNKQHAVLDTLKIILKA